MPQSHSSSNITWWMQLMHITNATIKQHYNWSSRKTWQHTYMDKEAIFRCRQVCTYAPTQLHVSLHIVLEHVGAHIQVDIIPNFLHISFVEEEAVSRYLPILNCSGPMSASNIPWFTSNRFLVPPRVFNSRPSQWEETDRFLSAD